MVFIPAHALSPAIPYEPEWNQEGLERLVEEKAKEYGVSASQMKATISCESGWDTDIRAQGQLSYGQEESYGLVQIHIRDHDVTIEQARDPVFAVEFMADAFSKGKQSWWTCWRKLYQ